MRALKAFIRIVDWCNTQMGKCAGWTALLMVLVVTVDVILRYLFNFSLVFVQELEWHLFGLLFLLGAGYTLFVDGHVRVDVFYQRWSARTQAWVNLVGVVLMLIPGCLLVIDTSWGFFLHSLRLGEGSPDPGGIPMRYLLKFVIPLGFTLLLFQGVASGLKNVLFLVGQPYEGKASDPAAENGRGA